MKKITNALTNKVFLDNKIIYKEYLISPFKKAYKNNELAILKILKREFYFKNNILSYPYIEGYNPEIINNEYLLKCANALKDYQSYNFSNLDNEGFLRATEFLKIENNPIIIEGLRLLNKKPQVLLHNDLVPGNFIASKKNDSYILIDFEYGGYGYFLFDIGSFITERDLTAEQEKYFINQFSNINLVDLNIIQKFLQLFWSEWAKYYFEQTNKEVYKKIYQWKIDRLNKLDN